MIFFTHIKPNILHTLLLINNPKVPWTKLLLKCYRIFRFTACKTHSKELHLTSQACNCWTVVYLKTTTFGSGANYNFSKEYNPRRNYFLLKWKIVLNIEAIFFTDNFHGFCQNFPNTNFAKHILVITSIILNVLFSFFQNYKLNVKSIESYAK